MFTRRHRIEKEQVQRQEPNPPECGTETQELTDTYDLDDGTLPHSLPHEDLDAPIALRKQPRTTAGKLPSKLSPYDVSNYVSYASLGSKYKSFVAALDSIDPIPHDWQVAIKDPRWRTAMFEEMEALDKNKYLDPHHSSCREKDCGL